MTELSRLIHRLQRGIMRNASYVKTIRHPLLLVVALKELNELIGNDKVKDSVATQVSHLIMVKRRSMESTNIREDEVMLNTVLYGPPGVGKTLVGTKLAKIWYSLGYLDGTMNAKEKKQEIGSIIKDLFKEGTGTSTTDDSSLVIYIMFFFLLILFTFLSMTWSFYTKFGGAATGIAFCLLLFIVLAFGYYVSQNMTSDSTNNTKNKEFDDLNQKDTINKNNIGQSINNREGMNGGFTMDDESIPSYHYDNINEYITSNKNHYVPKDSDIIKVVTRADFVDRYVGWTSPKTNKLLEENLGKVLFVDEAYSLINGPHDEFGMEALTALNLFLSQRPKEIIVIFAGYKDLLENGPYAVQPGLKRRFMWQFDCNGYTSEQLYQIFRLQLNKKGWDVSNPEEIKKIFKENMDAFPAFGGDTERAAFFSELEHSRNFIANETGMQINILDPCHVRKGIAKLRENNFNENTEETTNPLANMMKLMAGKGKTAGAEKEQLMNSLLERASNTMSK